MKPIMDENGYIHAGGPCPVIRESYVRAITREGHVMHGWSYHFWWGRETDEEPRYRPKTHTRHNEIVRYMPLERPATVRQPNQWRRFRMTPWPPFHNDP